MAKIQVTDSEEGTKVPFLRGILTRSLHEAGLTFEQAYELASTIRQELEDQQEITTKALHARALTHLQNTYGEPITSNYHAPHGAPVRILVRHKDGQISPFSRSQHQRCLESGGLLSEEAALVTNKIYHNLTEQGLAEISSGHLGRKTYDLLRETLGKAAAHRYMVWVDYTHSGRPLLLLIGGTTGSGKSTIATEVAHRIGIVRTQSTDMLREVMRMMIPRRLLPALHESSFNAWRVTHAQEQAKEDPDTALTNGYRSQAELLAVTCDAVIQRALRERVSLILEGVHVRPALLERIDQKTDAVIVEVMLAVLRRESLQIRIKGRGVMAPGRAAKQHLEAFDAIWTLQSFLLSEADQAKVPILANEDKDKAVRQVMATIIDVLADSFSASVEDVFS